MSLRDDDHLDALIDEVACDLTAANPPAGLAAHVRARISGRHRPRRVAAWQPVAAAAAVAVTITVATALWSERPAEVPAVRREPPPVSTDRRPAAVDVRPAAPGPDVSGEPRADVEARAGQPDLTATAAVAPLAPIEPLAVSVIDDPVLVAEMSGVAMPIEIEPLQLAPLELR